MSAQATYFKLGLFTIAGVALILAMIVVLGVGAIFRENIYLETYFDDSVQGLAVGAPVKYRGVTVGAVEEINMVQHKYPLDREDPAMRPFLRYVYVKINLTPTADMAQATPEERSRWLKIITQEGMRVRLASQGITGLAYVEADYIDDAGEPLPIAWEPEFAYIPSTASTMTRLSSSIVSILSNLEKIPWEEIGENLNTLLKTGDKAVVDLQVDELTDQLQGLVKRARAILDKPEVDALIDETGKAVADARGLIQDVRPPIKKAIENLEKAAGRIDTLADDVNKLVTSPKLEKTLEELPGAATQLRLTLQHLNQIVASNKQNVNAVLRNVKLISDNLQRLSLNARRYPSNVLFGAPPKASDVKAE